MKKCQHGEEHAASFDVSCGSQANTPNGDPDYRCDRVKGHMGSHHVCGDDWELNWS